MRSVSVLIICCATLLAPLPATVLPVYPYYFFLVAGVLIFAIKLLLGGRVCRDGIAIVSLFIAPSLFSALVSLPAVFMFFNDHRFDYSEGFWLGRVFNLLSLSIFFLFMLQSFKENNDLFFKAVRAYWWALLIILCTAIYQFFTLYFEFLPFPFDTRSWVHSALGEYGIKARLTGVAEEPSYLVPFAVDFIAVTLLVYGARAKTYFFSILSLTVLFFSFSPSGYLLIAVSSLFAFFSALIFNKLSISRKFLYGLGVLSFLIILMAPFIPVTDSYNYFQDRVLGFNPLESSRAYMNIMPLYWSTDGDSSTVAQYLIGHGVKAYSLIGQYYDLPNGMPVHSTSNNYFIDMFWEGGLVSLVLSLVFFLYLWTKLCQVKLPFFQSFGLYLLFFDFFLSMVFRAEFSSPRSFVILSILFFLYYRRDHSMLGNKYTPLSSGLPRER